jgi:O-antigen ligase
MLPAYAYRLAEFQRLLDGDNLSFPNPKNLWIRLLAETGFIGFSTFVIWLGLLAVTALKLRRMGTRLQRMVAVAALLALTAQILEGFSLDTFALPQLWIILGFLTAAAQQARVPVRSSLHEQCGEQSATASSMSA